jgi:hypothetical protein
MTVSGISPTDIQSRQVQVKPRTRGAWYARTYEFSTYIRIHGTDPSTNPETNGSRPTIERAVRHVISVLYGPYIVGIPEPPIPESFPRDKSQPLFITFSSLFFEDVK